MYRLIDSEWKQHYQTTFRQRDSPAPGSASQLGESFGERRDMWLRAGTTPLIVIFLNHTEHRTTACQTRSKHRISIQHFVSRSVCLSSYFNVTYPEILVNVLLCYVSKRSRPDVIVTRVNVRVSICHLTLWRPLLPYGYSYRASCADRVKPFICNFWHPCTSECPDVKNCKWRLNPLWYRMLYSCTHMATVGVKGLLDNRFIRLSAVRSHNQRSINFDGRSLPVHIWYCTFWYSANTITVSTYIRTEADESIRPLYLGEGVDFLRLF